MAAKTTTTNKVLQNEVNTLKKQNNQLSTSLNNLKDEIMDLRTQVNTFRRMVTEDIQKIVKKL